MRILLAAAAAASLAGCATYDGHGYGRDGDDGAYYRYDGTAWRARHGNGPLSGPGLATLDPWLAETEEGSVIVRAGWRSARRGFVDRRTAERANAWFRRYADRDGDFCLTDEEIRLALVWAAREVERGPRI